MRTLARLIFYLLLPLILLAVTILALVSSPEELPLERDPASRQL